MKNIHTNDCALSGHKLMKYVLDDIKVHKSIIALLYFYLFA